MRVRKGGRGGKGVVEGARGCKRGLCLQKGKEGERGRERVRGPVAQDESMRVRETPLTLPSPPLTPASLPSFPSLLALPTPPPLHAP